MKRMISMCIICVCVYLTGCTNLISKDPEKIVDDAFKKIVTAIENNDADAIKELFSTTAKAELSTLDADIDRFLAMFNGEVTKHYASGYANTSLSSDHGKRSINLQAPYIIESNDKIIHITIQYYILDTYDRNNEGLHSINIIDDTQITRGYVYRGDGKWSPGITFDTNLYKYKY